MRVHLWSAEAVHVDLDELTQVGDEEADVNAGAAVNLGRVLAGQQTDAHGSAG
jgi:hypothetical protein